jgi:hypothetical protein
VFDFMFAFAKAVADVVGHADVILDQQDVHGFSNLS